MNEKAFETEWFSIDKIYDHGYNDNPYYILSCNDSVEIMAVTDDEKIILIKQYRPAVGDYTLEFPAGYVDINESISDAARREFKEETGYVCDNMINMGAFKIVPSRINNDLHFFYGKGAKMVKKAETEVSEVVLVTMDELKALITNGHLKEVAALAMLYLAQSIDQI